MGLNEKEILIKLKHILSICHFKETTKIGAETNRIQCFSAILKKWRNKKKLKNNELNCNLTYF